MSHQRCSSCHSVHQSEFTAEINIHFPGMKGVYIPSVWVFPKILICRDCGAAQFTIPETERREIAHRDYRDFIDGTAA